MADEIWRAITGYEGLYEVSNFGRVKSVARKVWVRCVKHASYERKVAERILVPCLSERGHQSVALSKDGVEYQVRIHVLVLEAFVEPRPEGLYGCHRDGVPANNRETNLYWGTPVDNAADMKRHGTRLFGEACPAARLTEADILAIRSAKGVVSQGQIARIFGIKQGHVSRIMSGKIWAHLLSQQAGV